MRATPILSAIAAIALAAAAVPAQAADRAGGVTITSGGVSSLDVFTYQDSDDAYATFTITDPSGAGALISQCWEDADGAPYDCDTYLLEEADFADGDWRIKRTADGWQLRVYVAYYPFSDEECWDHAGGQEYGVNIGVLGEDDEVLDERTHSFTVICRGYAGNAKGSKTLKVSVGATSAALPIEFRVLDSRHDARSARGCLYSFTTGRLSNCTALDLAGGSVRSSEGWRYTARVTMPGVTLRQCKGIKKQEPRYAYQITFKDSSGDEMVTVSHRFTTTCR
ncbi:MAG: hypothetical protein ACKOMX_07350 [Actinomycetota bacterium]